MNHEVVEAITMYGERKLIPVSQLVFRLSAYFVAIEDDKVLLIKHSLRNLLGFPGGGVELGETCMEALMRESEEELGTSEIEIGELIGIGENFYYYDETGEAFHALLLFYHGKILDKTAILKPLNPNDIETDPQWYEIKDLVEYQFGELKVGSFMAIIKKAQS